jgi:hypothetical protein
MRTVFLICLAFLFLTSCSTNNNSSTTPPATPTNLTASVVSSTQVNLQWTDNSTSEDGYKIQRKTSGGNFVDVGSTGVDITSFSDFGLTPNTSYTYRVYAFNSAGNSLQYSNEVTVYTVNAASLPNVTIGSQIWSTKNLDVTNYLNGDPIPQVTDPTQWANLTTGAWCYYNNDPANGPIYGKLYNWYAVNDVRGLAPQGWHVPTDLEWQTLYSFLTTLVGSGNEGGAMKNTTGWNSPNLGATNITGFSGLPAGSRSFDGTFAFLGVIGSWWTSTSYGSTSSLRRTLVNSNSLFGGNSDPNIVGLSVRVVKN